MFGRLSLLEFFAGRAGLGFEFQVLDHVLRSLGNDVTDIVKAFTPGASCDLVEVAGCEDGRLVAAVLAELRKEDRADRNVHAYAERVRAADDLEKPLLGELFAEDAVLGQEPCVVDADALLEPALDIRAVWTRKTDLFNGFVDLGLFFFGAEVKTHEVLGVAGGGGLRKMDDVNGSLALVHELLHFGRNFSGAVAEVERHRTLRGADGHGFATRMLGHIAFEEFGRTDGRTHQEKA